MSEPLLRRLKERGERLTVGALPSVAPVYRAMPQVHQVVELPPRTGLRLGARWMLARQLRSLRFDAAYVLPNSFKSALLPFLARIPKRIGYLGEARFGLLTQRLPDPASRPPMVAFYSALAGEPGIEQDRPRLHIDDAAMEAALARWRVVRGGYVAFAPGAEFGPAKRWPAGRFGELARSIDMPVLLLGSGKEAALCEEIAHGAPQSRPSNLAGKTSLSEAFALIAGAACVVGNDSGLMHVAAAFGVPQVAIFGSSSPRHTPPLNERAQVIWLRDDPDYAPPLNCAPCFERGCPLGHTRCLNDVEAARVLQKMEHAGQVVHGAGPGAPDDWP